jgi:hypothetical protein
MAAGGKILHYYYIRTREERGIRQNITLESESLFFFAKTAGWMLSGW